MPNKALLTDETIAKFRSRGRTPSRWADSTPASTTPIPPPMPIPAELRSLDWSQLHHAYGPATDVPDLLEALVAPEVATQQIQSDAMGAGRSVREHIQWVLYGNVFHQGSVWQATAPTVPFLVDILLDGPDDHDLQEFLVSYLHNLAMGYPEDSFPAPFELEQVLHELDGIEDPGGEPDYENELLAGVWARDSYLAVERSLPSLAHFAESPNEAVSLETIALLSAFPRQGAVSVPILERVAATARGQRAGHAIVSLSRLVGHEAHGKAQELTASEEAIVALHAACAVVLSGAEPVGDEVVALLTSPLGDVEDMRSVHAGSMKQLVARCLPLLPESNRVRALKALAAQHQNATPMELLTLTQCTLSIAFGDGQAPKKAKDLTDAQREAIQAICDHGAFRVAGGQFANYCSLLTHRGLPSAQRELARWLKGK